MEGRRGGGGEIVVMGDRVACRARTVICAYSYASEKKSVPGMARCDIASWVASLYSV